MVDWAFLIEWKLILVPCEHTTGDKKIQGLITKARDAHLRYSLVENSWHYYQRKPNINEGLRRRQEAYFKEVKKIVWKAQHRLHHKYRKLVTRGCKSKYCSDCRSQRINRFYLGG